jgi:Family of unknown function (DUF6152)
MHSNLPLLVSGALALLALWKLPSANAHHSLVGTFDVEHQFELHGNVTRVEWVNPHASIELVVTTEQGKTEHWRCELGSLRQLASEGWNQHTLVAGVAIRALAFRARDGSKSCSTRQFKLDDGISIFSKPR